MPTLARSIATARAVVVLPWPWAALVGSVLLAAGGLLVALRGRRWAVLSGRYDAPAARRTAPEVSAWEALDRGEDPTRRGGSGPT